MNSPAIRITLTPIRIRPTPIRIRPTTLCITLTPIRIRPTVEELFSNAGGQDTFQRDAVESTLFRALSLTLRLYKSGRSSELD